MRYDNDQDNRGYENEPLEPFPVRHSSRDGSGEQGQASPRSSGEARHTSGTTRRRSSSGQSRSQSAAESAAPTRRQRGNGGNKKDVMKRTLAIVAVLLGVTIGIVFYAIGLLFDLLGLGQPDLQAMVEIPLGTSTTETAQILKRSKVIDHPIVFALYSKLGSSGKDFQAGTYLLNSNMGYDQIIVTLRSGDGERQTETITVIEGMTQRQIGEMLEERGVCLASEFNEYLENLDLAESGYTFANYLGEEKDGRFRRLEGYLFPDTYEFFKGEKVSSVVNKFLSRFDEMMTEELYGQMKERNMTLDQVITLASIIQKECSSSEEMGMVSSVFHNRLTDTVNYPKLQSDVTILYVENDIKPFLNIKDQDLYDRYNTYVCTGLPVGPICNPGLDVIKAALAPEKSDYYFFLTDSEGKYYYANTFDEHLQNQRAAEKVGNGDSHGIDTQQ